MKDVTTEDGIALWSTRASTDERHVPWGWLALLTALAVLLRAIGLNGGLWYDEILTMIEGVRDPLYQIVTVFPGNNQHTLFSVLAHISMEVFGEHPWSLRLPALVFGAATVPVLYLFARQFATRSEALLGCLLLTTAYHHVWFSQNARGYTALAFLTLLSSWLLLRVLRHGKTSDAVWYGVAAALGVYAHLTMVFLVVSHAMLCAAAAGLAGRDAPVWRRWRVVTTAIVLAGAFTLLLYSPVMLDVKQFFVDRPAQGVAATPTWAARELIRGLQIGLGAGLGALAAAVLFAAGLWSYLRQSLFVVGLFVLPGVVTVGAAVALGRPLYPRFVFFLIGFGLLIAVRGALEIGQWFGRSRAQFAGTALVVAMAVVSVVALIPNYQLPKQDFEAALHLVEAQRTGDDVIVTVGQTTRVYREFYHRTWESAPSLEQFQSIRARGQRVWVVHTLDRYIEGRTPDLMRMLRAECVVQQVFRGTVGDGDVTVCVAPPVV